MFEMKEGYKEFDRRAKNGKIKKFILDKDDKPVAKFCNTCSTMKELSAFSRRKENNYDGRMAQCKACTTARSTKWQKENPERVKERDRRFYVAHAEARRRYSREWKEKNPDRVKKYNEENKERRAEIARVWDLENKDRRRANNKAWREDEKNKERIKKLARIWAKKNSDKKRQANRKRRALKKELPSTITDEDLEVILKIQDGKCLLSNSTMPDLEVDHFIPLTWAVVGDTFENISYMEKTLNRSKGHRNPFVWINTQPEEIQNRFYALLLPMMAERNDMDIDEFIYYVYECEQEAINSGQIEDIYI